MSHKKVALIKKPQSLRDIAVESIRDAIIRGSFELGESISEAALVRLLGISKTPIREALTILNQEGLISVVPQKGTFVFTLSATEVAQLGQYRFVLESYAVDLAMAQDSSALVTDLHRICERMLTKRKEKKMDEYLQLDAKYHETIFNYCGNGYLQDGYKLVSGKIAALRTHLSQHPTHTEKSFHEHIQMVKLFQQKKVKQAKSVLKQHVTRGERSYADTVKDIAQADKDPSLQ
jgi:DNA-binding GntR family transcriptional regulator